MNDSLAAPKQSALKKGIKLLLLALIVSLSVFVARPFLTNPATYGKSMDYLDEKKQNAMMISLGSASASFIVTMIPDDTGTPIAGELAKLSSYLLFVMSAILLERYLLTAIGFFSTCVIIPIACLMGAFAVFAQEKNRQKFKEYAVKFLIFAVCIAQIIPIGCVCGRGIEKANEASISAALNDAKNANEIVQSIPDDKKNKNIFDKVGDFFSGLWNSATEAYEWAKSVLSNFLSSVSVMLVTTIAIPILIFLAYIFLIRALTKHDFTASFVSFIDNTIYKITHHGKTAPQE